MFSPNLGTTNVSISTNADRDTTTDLCELEIMVQVLQFQFDQNGHPHRDGIMLHSLCLSKAPF